MPSKPHFIVLFLILGACVEPYEFVIKNNGPALVVEGFISDKSFTETLSYPSDGRYFSVKLSSTGDVTNVRPIPVTGAIIELLDSEGATHVYRESPKIKGTYQLIENDFKAKPGISYKLRIAGTDESTYESSWEKMPDVLAPSMGEIGFAEDEILAYNMEAGKWILRSFKGVQTYLTVPENDAGEPIHYRWTFTPLWIFKAVLSSVIDPGHICWATDVNYLNTYEVQTDLAGGYRKDLFFIRTIRNERIFEKFSVLVHQYSMTKSFSDFWTEMKERNEGSNIVDKPPYNLMSNFTSTSGKPVHGYFGVVGEQARRWYFSKSDLSYTVVNTLREDCLANFGGPPAPECFNCTMYSFGIATTKRPAWWK